MIDMIKTKLRESLLFEKLIDVDVDVDFIYDKYFKDSIITLGETGVITTKTFKVAELTTEVLTSDLSVKANSVNPCKILVNYGTNTYNPFDKVINVSVNNSAVDFVVDYGGHLNDAANSIDNTNSLLKEFTEAKIKGSIHHELVHWIDDSLHNSHIKKTLGNKETMRKIRSKDVDTNYFEIQAQIHNIHQLKRKYDKIWDTITFNELVNMSPTLMVIRKKLNGDKLKDWVKRLKVRMHREGLLGKKMVN